jgi:Tryptophan halogenase
MNKSIEKITVVGAGTTGYLTALCISKAYPSKSITWIYPEDNTPIGVGEAIVPAVANLLKMLGVSHADIIRECRGTIKLGSFFEGWNRPGESFSFPFGFNTENPRHNSASLERIIETGKVPDDILQYSDIATHFRATELLKYLDSVTPNFKNLTVERRTVTKEELEGTYDLLFDCTGFRREFSKWPDNFLSIQDKIPNNQAFIYRSSYTNIEKQCLPYTLAYAMDYGWVFNIPLKDEIACGYVHPDKYDVMDEFVEYLKNKFEVDNIDISKIRKVPMVTGRNKIHIKDNVVSMGLASMFIEPLESTGIFFVVVALNRIIQYINGKITEQEYSEAINNEYDALVDFIIAHYKYSARSNEYWDHYKNIEIGDPEISLFSKEALSVIMSGFDTGVARPKEKIDHRELINIHKGKKYHEWLQDPSNYKDNVTVGVSGYHGYLASKLRHRPDVNWVDRTSDIDYYLHLGSPTFTEAELTQANAQTMHQYVKETIELIDSLKVPIIFASTTGVDDIRLDHKGSTCYNLAKLYLENYIINHCDNYMILRIGTIVASDLIDVMGMKPDRLQQRILRGDYKGIPMEDKYLDIKDFVNTTADKIKSFKTGIVNYNLKTIKLSELIALGK